MSHEQYVDGEEAPVLDPYSPSFTMKPITKYFLKCYERKCFYNTSDFCTCLTGHCYPEENGKVFDIDSRIIVQI